MKMPSKKGLKKVTYEEFKERLMGITDYCMKQFEMLYKISDSLGITKLNKSEIEQMLDQPYDPRYGNIKAMDMALKEYIKNSEIYRGISKEKDDWEYYVDTKTDVIQAFKKGECMDFEDLIEEKDDNNGNKRGMYT